jgi:hypothetical protein
MLQTRLTPDTDFFSRCKPLRRDASMLLRHLSLRVIVLLMSLCLLVGVTAGRPAITHAASNPTKSHIKPFPKMAGVGPLVSVPTHTTSYYESTTGASTLKNQGCNAAKGAKGIVVLDFGEPFLSGSTYGTYLFGGGGFASDGTITTAAEDFVNGAWGCRTSSTNILLAIGTSNYTGDLGGASGSTWNTAGRKWGGLVNNVYNYISSKGYSNKILAAGADDIEVEWASYGQSSNFVSGYNSTASIAFFDYGDDSPGYWTNAQVYYVAYGATDDFALPEIYYNADATQDWEPLSYWACSNEGGPIYFSGTMAEYPTGNTPAEAWADLYDAEGAHTCTAAARSALVYSTNI